MLIAYNFMFDKFTILCSPSNHHCNDMQDKFALLYRKRYKNYQFYKNTFQSLDPPCRKIRKSLEKSNLICLATILRIIFLQNCIEFPNTTATNILTTNKFKNKKQNLTGSKIASGRRSYLPQPLPVIYFSRNDVIDRNTQSIQC